MNMKRLAFLILALVFSVAAIGPSYSQSLNSICVIKERNQGEATVQDCINVDSTNPFPTSAVVTPGGTQNVNLNQINGATPGIANPLVVIQSTAYPIGASPVTASATGTTAATVATLPAFTAKTTYICGFSITSTATAALAGAAVVSGTVTGSMNFVQGVGVAPAVGQLNQTFNPCVPSSAVNTAIVTTSAAPGLGGVIAVTAWGYQL